MRHALTILVFFALTVVAVPARSALVGWWTFDGTLDDASGLGNHGSYVGGGLDATFSSDVPAAIGSGESIDFQGAEAIRVLHSASLLFDQEFTVSYWIRGSAADLSNKTMGKRRKDDSKVGWEIQDADGSGMRSRMTTFAPDATTFGPELDASDDAWHHVAYVVAIRDGAIEHDLYLDGDFVATMASGVTADSLGNTGDFWIGSGGDNDGTFYTIAASVDEVSLYDEALSPFQIGLLAAGTRPDALFCMSGGTTLCLAGGRFEVEVEWRDFAGKTGVGTVVTRSEDSGLLWFFNPKNWEMLVKVLDGCKVNNRFWVFAAATTSVEYSLRVTDTATGQVSDYFNTLGEASPAITDTHAFATCP